MPIDWTHALDIPLAGDFNDAGLGAADISYFFGNPGDKPFVGDFTGNGVETTNAATPSQTRQTANVILSCRCSWMSRRR